MGNLLRFTLFLIFVNSFIIFTIIYNGINISIDSVFRSFGGAGVSTDYKYCYKESHSTIVFLHLTNASDEWSPLHACIFKRAAILHPAGSICVLSKIKMQQHSNLTSLSNIEFAVLDNRRIFNGTPISSWYEDYVLNETLASNNVVAELSDGLRYAYLYNFGGKYLDTDTLLLRSVAELRNTAGKGGPRSISNGNLFFDKGHPFIKAVLDQFMPNFQRGVWGSVGPTLVTKIHFDGLVDNSTYRLLQPYALYPMDFSDYRRPFSVDEKAKEVLKSMVNESYALHLFGHMLIWNGMGDYWTNKSLPVGSFVEELCNN